ncbi:hypothetical protein AB7M17_008151 [Bradyrhizobium sp. USDA 377]
MKHEMPREPYDDEARDSPAQKRWQLEQLVAALRVSREETHSIRRDGEARRAPSREALQAILDGLTEALFPRHYGQFDLDGENIDYFDAGHRPQQAGLDGRRLPAHQTALQRLEDCVEGEADHGDSEDAEIHLRDQEAVLAVDDEIAEP